MRLRLTLLVLLLPLFAGSAPVQGATAKTEIVLPVRVRPEWKALPTTQPAGGGYAAATYSAVRIDRALDQTTGQPYNASSNPFKCEPTDLRRSFRLDKNNFLLGEPIVVEFRIELAGPGQWTEESGGNFRRRGRDDSFLFLVKRRDDSSWLQDPYGAMTAGVGGGLGGPRLVSKDNPSSAWNGLQRWTAIDAPGVYDLYCIQFYRTSDILGKREALIDALPADLKDKFSVSEKNYIVEKTTGLTAAQYTPVAQLTFEENPSSPVLDQIPAAVRERLDQPLVSNVMDYAHFEITITDGTPDQRATMVKEWTAAATAAAQTLTPEERIRRAAEGLGMFTEGRRKATREAIWFVRQNDFLPFMGNLIATDPKVENDMLMGLAMHPSPQALDLLFKAKPRQIMLAVNWLPPAKIPQAIPRLIDWLGGDDPVVRNNAEIRLQAWTGQSFGHDWEGMKYDRPTLQEGQKMQPLWRDWWEKNKGSFVAK